MLEDLVSVILLLIVGVAALAMGIFLILDYQKRKKLYHLFWGISFLVLFVSGVLIILFNFTILNEPLVPVVAALVPACLAIGLLYALYEEEKFGFYYLIYVIVMLVVLTMTKFVNELTGLSTLALLAVHVPSALIIIGLPLLFISKKELDNNALLFSLAGLLISVGGMLLAFLKFNMPILTADQIFAILPLLLLIVGVLFILGIVLPEKWKVDIPILK